MKKLLFSLFFMCLSYAGFSQTAVYFCTTNGAVGYSSGYSNSPTYAFNSCVKHGGTTPYLVSNSSTVGYVAIAIGYTADGARVIGVVHGYSTKTAAENAAFIGCYNEGGKYNTYILDSFYDYCEYK